MSKLQMIRFLYLSLFSVFCFFKCVDVVAQDDDSDGNSPPQARVLAPPPDINLQGQVPQARFVNTTHDFENIYRGQKVNYSFRFENSGNGILVFGSIHAVCGCIETKIYAEDGKTIKTRFKPGEKGMVDVEFDSRDFAGAVMRPITIATNMGSSSPTITLKVMANVLEELSANPPLIYLGDVQEHLNKQYSVDLRLIGRAQKDGLKKGGLKIFSIESTVPYVKATLSDVTNEQAKVRIRLVDKSIPIGPISAKVIVRNNSTWYPNFEIPVIGQNDGSVQFSAKFVEFGVVKPNKPASRFIVIKSVNKDFTITEVKINLRELAITLKNLDLFEIKKEKSSISSQTAYKLSFKLRYPDKLADLMGSSSAPATNVSGAFEVSTNDPDYPKIVIPFFGVLGK